MQEEELYHWWQYYERSGKTIKSGRRRLRVLNSGLLNTASGPDFIAARFELDGIIYQGDVECHRKTSDWYAHNHHLDKSYRQVALHLVAHSKDHTPVTSRWRRQPICTLMLPRPVTSPLDTALICQPSRSFQKQLRFNLIRLALNWFDQKVKYFINNISVHNGSSIFYTHFFRALGYPANANTFQLLAEQLSWAWLIQNKEQLQDCHQVLYAVYAGQAGFIPEGNEDDYMRTIKEIYRKYTYLLPGDNFYTELWQFAGNRPCNHVHFRLAAGLQVLLHHNFFLYDQIIELLQKRREYASALTAIKYIFKLPLNSYWSKHYALGKKRRGSAARICFSDARIVELLINVILPLSGAHALLTGSEGYYSYLQAFYLYLPLTSVYGVFEKKQVPWYKICFETNSFQTTNHALLMLESVYCHHHLCEHCPVNRVFSVSIGKTIDNKIKNI